MNSSPNSGTATAERLNLLPLLPLRPPAISFGASRSHDTHLESMPSDWWKPSSLESATVEATLPGSGFADPERSIEQTHRPLAAARITWDRFLCCATESVLKEELAQAVEWLQRAHAWKNRWETTTLLFLPLKSAHWITLSACSTAVADDDTAAAFAIRAWESAGCHWSDDLDYDFRDSRADASSLLSLVRLRQHRPDRAVKLLERGIVGHRQVGDLEQQAADYLLLGLCLEAERDSAGAEDARQSAAHILNDSLDPTRHQRQGRLAAWLSQYGQPRPFLMKDTRLI
jgi:hypothetical protein